MPIKRDSIFKRTVTGAIQEWYLEINEEGDSYRAVSGQIEGKKHTSTWTRCHPKNVGRSNETSPQEQCLFEVESAYTHKLERGYMKTPEEVDETKFKEPMRAQTFNDKTKPSRFDIEDGLVYSQPKLDGMRDVASRHGQISRQGKEIISAPHITEQLQPVFDALGPNIEELDGELYSDKLADNFQKIMSLAKKKKPTEKDLEESAKYLQYWVYDIPGYDGPFSERIEILRCIEDISPAIRLVPTVVVESPEHLDELMSEYLLNKMEGQMVRLDGPGYEYKRSKQLLKRKEFEDREFIIKEIVEGEGNRSGVAGAIQFETDEGKEFRAGIAGGMEFYRELLENRQKYIGEEATVRFMGFSNDGIPRHPVVKAIRDVE